MSQDMSGRAALAQMIKDAGRVTAFTGAGMSTDSGIPDFRSPGGVWSRMKPILFDQFLNDEAMRREAWRRAFTGAAGWTGAEPNAGHDALTMLIAAGKAGAVITQNVDNLHQGAGTPAEQVIELHGNASYAGCLDCGLRHDLAALEEPFMERGRIPMCRSCGGVVKVATISFGQSMPRQPMARARAETLACDLFLVLGSSLLVTPAASFPRLAKRNGARLAIVNREPTPQDADADLVLHDEISAVLVEVVSELGPIA
jgi:NAD-dependent deacetylase